MKYSIIILLKEQHQDFSHFVKDLHKVFSDLQEPFEIILVVNGLGGFFRTQAADLNPISSKLRIIEFRTSMTEALCLKTAYDESCGEIIAVLESYQQITNESLIELLNSFDSETDIVTPWRRKRVDPTFNQFQSKLFNSIVKFLVKTDLHDLSCSVKIFRRKVMEETAVYGNMYRFLPILAAQRGFKTKEVKCKHYEERGKTGFYSLNEYVTRLIDILTVYFNVRFIKKPLRFFSTIGMIFLLIGTFLGGVIFIERLTMGALAGNRPLLLLAIFFMVMGVQIASIGLLGEIVVFTHGRNKKDYTIEKIIH
jgi:hypothetical protein